jgi:hypothetical protein
MRLQDNPALAQAFSKKLAENVSKLQTKPMVGRR